MATPQETLIEVRDKLQDLPERLASVLARGKSERDPNTGRWLPKGEQKQLGRWQAMERLLGAAGGFIPAIGQLGGVVQNVRHLGESLEQFIGAWIPQKQQALPRPMAPEGPRLSPMMAGLQPESLKQLQTPDSGLTELKAPMQTQGLGSSGLQAGGGVSSLVARLQSLTDKMDDLAEAIEQTKPETAQKEEIMTSSRKQTELMPEAKKTAIREVTQTKHHRREVGQGLPHNIPQAIPGHKEGIWGHLGAVADKVLPGLLGGA